jgi:perosamine synthetase
MGKILRIADAHDIPVIEDAAEALLSRYRGKKYAGTLGKVGIFSFTPSKPMTVGEGGMLVTNDGEIAERARMARNFGEREKFSWEVLGFNFRMMDIQGAIGICQIGKVHEAIRRRRVIGEKYTRAFTNLPGIITPYVRCPDDMNYQLYTIRINEKEAGISRDVLMQRLDRQGVASRLYHPAIHRAPVFSSFDPGSDKAFPNACEFARTALSLPIYPSMTENELLCVNAVTRSLHYGR